MAVTPVGNPYVESSDLVANYPGASEALAERIDIVGVNPFANAAARDAAIPSPVQGQMCSLNDDNKGYRYDGSAWVLFSGAGPGNFTNTATGTYTDGEGIDWKYIKFTGNGNLVIDRAGECTLLVLGGGGGGRDNFWNGEGGYRVTGDFQIAEATHAVVVGAGGAASAGEKESFGKISSIGTFCVTSGGVIDGNSASFSSSITGTSVTYATGTTGSVTANSGNGGSSVPGIAGSSGVVVVAVRT